MFMLSKNHIYSNVSWPTGAYKVVRWWKMYSIVVLCFFTVMAAICVGSTVGFCKMAATTATVYLKRMFLSPMSAL